MEPEILVLDKELAGLIHYCPVCGALTRPAPDFLTRAELEVLSAIGRGASTTAIASRRCVSPHSVDSIVGLLCQKFGIKRGPGGENVMVMLARKALELGLSTLSNG